MSKVTLLNAGFLIRVTSWENDGDNYQTVDYNEVDGVRLGALLQFLELFKHGSEFANCYDDLDMEALLPKVLKINEICPSLLNLVDGTNPENEDEVYVVEDAINDVMSDFGLTSEWAARVVDRIEVFQIDTAVVVERLDAQCWSRR